MITYPTEAVRETMERWFGLFPVLRETRLQITTYDEWEVCELEVGHYGTRLEIHKATGYVTTFRLEKEDQKALFHGERINAESATARATEVAERLYGDHLKEMTRDRLARLYKERVWRLSYRYFFHGIPFSEVFLQIWLDESGNLTEINYRGFEDFDRRNKPKKPNVMTKDEAKQAYLALFQKNMVLVCDEQDEAKLKYIPDEAAFRDLAIHAETGQPTKIFQGSSSPVQVKSEVIRVAGQGQSIILATVPEMEAWVKDQFQIDITHPDIKMHTLVTPNEDQIIFNPISANYKFSRDAKHLALPPTVYYTWPLPEEEGTETVYDPDLVWISLNQTTKEVLAFSVNQKIDHIAPRLTEQDALQIGTSFLEKYIDQGITELHYNEVSRLRGTGITYEFYERRQGVVLTNRIYRVKVNPWTGQVTGFYKHDARTNKILPDFDACMSAEEAAEIFLDQYDVELDYIQIEYRRPGRKEKDPVPFPAYWLKHASPERYKYVDAITKKPCR